MYLTVDKNKKVKINRINKLMGLMFKKESIKEGYIFYRCGSIHTFFMKQNIDVLILNKDYIIIKIISNLKRNKIIICKKGYITLELPLNTSKYFKIGDKIKIIE